MSRHQTDQRRGSRLPYFQLALQEPFRLFFPLGMLLGLIGVLIWPLFFWGLYPQYPLAAHTRLLINGFLGCFVFGFLLTAGPRLLSCPPCPPLFVRFMAAASLLTAGFAFVLPVASDLLFAAQLLAVAGLATRGFALRGDMPPPGFLLAAGGLLCGLIGVLMIAAQEWLGWVNATSYVIARVLLYEGFTALPLLGVGAFFFPKLSATENPHDLPERPHPNRAWLKRAVWSAGTLLAFLATLPMQAKGYTQLAYLIRAAAFALYLLRETPLLRRPRAKPNQKLHFTLCSVLLVTSFLAVAFWPEQKVNLLHLLFMGSMAGSILLVATRVTLGHSGNASLARRSGKPLLAGLVALALAAVARIKPEALTSLRSDGLIAIALVWVAVAAAWLVLVAPKTTVPDTE